MTRRIDGRFESLADDLMTDWLAIEEMDRSVMGQIRQSAAAELR